MHATMIRRVFFCVTLALALMSGRKSQAPVLPSSEVSFEEGVVKWWEMAQYHWAVQIPPLDEERIVARVAIEAGQHFWPGDISKWNVLVQLRITEGPNPRDPSLGKWGVMVEAAREVERAIIRRRLKDHAALAFPVIEEDLIRKLSHDIWFNGFVAAGYLKLQWNQLPVSHETRAIIRFKMGPRGDYEGSAAGIRKRHYWRTRESLDCVLDGVRAGKVYFGLCMR